MKLLLDRLLGRKARFSVLMVCSGNICRSPTAEAVLAHRLNELGLGADVRIDSAGIESYHVGEAPDRRSQTHAAKRGYDLSKQRARRFVPEDFERFDLILAMDRGHLKHLLEACTEPHRVKLALLLGDAEVPDPFYGGPAGFERVLDLIEAGCSRLAPQLQQRLRQA